VRQDLGEARKRIPEGKGHPHQHRPQSRLVGDGPQQLRARIKPPNRQADDLPDIVVTPEMANAGARVIATSGLTDEPLEADTLVTAEIYRAMRRLAPHDD
jgi:hypothetical protein